MDIIVIMAHFTEVENVAETFLESHYVHSLQINLGLGLNPILELFLDFFPVLFVVLDELNFLWLFYWRNQLLHLCFIDWVCSFQFSFFYQPEQVSGGSFIVVEFIGIGLSFLFVKFVRVEKDSDFLVVLFAFFVLFSIVNG